MKIKIAKVQNDKEEEITSNHSGSKNSLEQADRKQKEKAIFKFFQLSQIHWLVLLKKHSDSDFCTWSKSHNSEDKISHKIE